MTGTSPSIHDRGHRAGSGGHKFTAPADGFVPFRDKPVNSRIVECIDCGSPIGVFCVRKDGTRKGYCKSRRKRALRKLNERL